MEFRRTDYGRSLLVGSEIENGTPKRDDLKLQEGPWEDRCPGVTIRMYTSLFVLAKLCL